MEGLVVVHLAWYVLSWTLFFSSSRSVSLSSGLLPTSPRLLRYGGTTRHGPSCITSSLYLWILRRCPLVSCLCSFSFVVTVPGCLVVCSR